MNTVPLWVQILALVTLTCTSAFFSISETALMALNRHRVKHQCADYGAGDVHCHCGIWQQ
jgi:Mg2+/Co2+ transporter CorB